MLTRSVFVPFGSGHSANYWIRKRMVEAILRKRCCDRKMLPQSGQKSNETVRTRNGVFVEPLVSAIPR
jgi:hypothetical protein